MDEPSDEVRRRKKNIWRPSGSTNIGILLRILFFRYLFVNVLCVCFCVFFFISYIKNIHTNINKLMMYPNFPTKNKARNEDGGDKGKMVSNKNPTRVFFYAMSECFVLCIFTWIVRLFYIMKHTRTHREAYFRQVYHFTVDIDSRLDDR